MFSSVLTGTTTTLSVTSVAICILASLVCGMIVAFTYKACSKPSKALLAAIAVIPAIVQMVILMVNGNLGVGVAVAGSFSLVRFRSLPGKSTDIAVIFLAMGLGLCTGMGYVVFALCMAVVLCAALFLFLKTPVLSADTNFRCLRITVPEDLDYAGVLDEVFGRYTKKCEEIQVKTANLGTMYQLIYEVEMNDPEEEKKMIDELRIRNGNLPIICSKHGIPTEEL